MRGFFYPESVAVLGVSPRYTNLGRAITTNLISHHYTGRISLVGPRGGYVYGHRVHPALEEVEGEVDLAVILTPAATVPAMLEDCGRKGIKRVVVESGGFGEYDESRKELEKELLAIAQKYDMRFIGPNGIGVMNKETGLVLPFPKISTDLKNGEVSIVSQSGGVALTYVNFLNSERIGVNKFVSVGNKLNVDENDLVEFLIQDEGTKVICLYLESVTDGRRLMNLARSTDKPILVHKSNTSPQSARIAASHTAALSTDEAVVDAAFEQAGIIRVKETRNMVNYLKILTKPRMKGNRVAIVSRSGGHAVIAADACAANGLELPPFPRDFLDQFEKHFRGGVIKIQNPIDLGDLFDFSVYTTIAEAILRRDEIDGMIFAHGYRGAETPQSREFVQAAADMVSRFGKPLAMVLLVEENEMAHVKTQFDFPVFASPEEGADCLRVSALVHRNGLMPRMLQEPESSLDHQALERIIQESPPGLPLSLDLAAEAGLPVAPWRLARGWLEVREAAGELGYPLALKTANPEISHKTEAGGVVLGLKDGKELEAGVEKLVGNLAQAGYSDPWPVVVQKMAAPGREVIIGGRQDPNFGPVVLFGLGGIMVEVLGDVALRAAPIDQGEALAMMDELKAGAILDGVRGEAQADKKALAQAVVRMAELLIACPEIKEIDLNPVMAYPQGQGLMAVDARVVVE